MLLCYAKMLNICWFYLRKCEDLLRFIELHIEEEFLTGYQTKLWLNKCISHQLNFGLFF